MNRRIFLTQCGITYLGLETNIFSALASNSTNSSKLNPKKGIGMATKSGGWKQRLNKLNVQWHYSWGLRPKDDYPEDIKFIPMMWGKWGVEKAVAYLNEQKKAGNVDCVLGFNEPDRKTQSNIPVKLALDLWPTLMEANVRLGAPSCVHPDNEWMKTFMKKADERQLRVDFVPIHDYGGPSPKALVNKCKSVYEMYGRPVWITEFAVGDWKAKHVSDNVHTPKRVLEFMKEVLPELDKLDYVERYAWFPADSKNSHLGTSALFNDDGDLTPLGHFYANH